MAHVKSPKNRKNHQKAIHFRQQGNRLFGKKEYDDALTNYNESICWAETGSEDLGIAYANRSAVFCAIQEYEFALSNIVLAKRNNYPERLMAKLEARERECWQQLADPNLFKDEAGLAKLYPKLVVNVEVNPRIPFIAKGMHAEEDPVCGIIMVADRDFKVGDVILSEKPLVGCLNPNVQNRFCDNCMGCYLHVLIPCPHCVYAMYCSEECMEKGWKRFHRFECDISQQLHEKVHEIGFAYTGVRMFLYGLGLFQDDVEKMMEFVEAHPRTGSDTMTLDYVNFDPLEEFKLIQMAKSRQTLTTIFYPVKSFATHFYKVYLENSTIQSLFNTKAKQDFMHRCFMDYSQAFPWLCREGSHSFEFCTIASNFNRKTYAESNITSLNVGGCVKVVVQRAVSKGSQLTLQLPSDPTSNNTCTGGCNSNSPGSISCSNKFPSRDLNIMFEVLSNPSIDSVAGVNAMQQFLQKYSHLYTRCRFSNLVDAYQNLLREVCLHQLQAEMRVEAMAGLPPPEGPTLSDDDKLPANESC